MPELSPPLDLCDFSRLQVAEKLAVGNDRDLLILRPQLLQQQDADDRGDHVPKMELRALVQFGPFGATGTPISGCGGESSLRMAPCGGTGAWVGPGMGI
jgi:hypothetical protein